MMLDAKYTRGWVNALYMPYVTPSTPARINTQNRLRRTATASDNDVSPASDPLPARCGSDAPGAKGNCVFCGPIPPSLPDTPFPEEGDIPRPSPKLGICPDGKSARLELL